MDKITHTVTSLTWVNGYVHTKLFTNESDAVAHRTERMAKLKQRHPGLDYFNNGMGNLFGRAKDQNGLIGFVILEEQV